MVSSDLVWPGPKPARVLRKGTDMSKPFFFRCLPTVLMVCLLLFCEAPPLAAGATDPDVAPPEYLAKSKILPARSAEDLLPAPAGDLPALIRLLPGLYDQRIEEFKQAGLWDDPAQLGELKGRVGEPFQGRYAVDLQSGAETGLERLIFLTGLLERLRELRSLTLEEDLSLNRAYQTLAVFPGPALARFRQVVTSGAGSGDSVDPQVKLWTDLSRAAGQAHLYSARNLLQRRDLLPETRAEILRGVTEESGVDGETALSAQNLARKLDPTPAGAHDLIERALRLGYYRLAEEVYQGLGPAERDRPELADTQQLRREAMELETASGDRTYEARLRRADLLWDLQRRDQAEKLYQELVGEDQGRAEAWAGLAKAVWDREAPDLGGVEKILGKAWTRVKEPNATLLEMKIGLGVTSIYTGLAAAGLDESTWMARARAALAVVRADNGQLARLRPELSELTAITLDFLEWPLSAPDNDPCAAPYSQFYQRIRAVLQKLPGQNRVMDQVLAQALELELVLSVMARGLDQSVDLMTRALPETLSPDHRAGLRKMRARLLLAAAWNADQPSLLDRAETEIQALAGENPEDQTWEIELLLGHLWALRGSSAPDSVRPENYARALAHYRQALPGTTGLDRPLVLNNLLFLELALGPDQDTMKIRERLLNLTAEDHVKTLILANLLPLEKDMGPEDVVGLVRAEPGSRAYGALTIVAGGMAGAQGRNELQKELFTKALTGLELCRDFPLCRKCYRPGLVFVTGDFQWALNYGSADGLSIPVGLKTDFWLLHPNRPGGWPSLEDLKPYSHTAD